MCHFPTTKKICICTRFWYLVMVDCIMVYPIVSWFIELICEWPPDYIYFSWFLFFNQVLFLFSQRKHSGTNHSSGPARGPTPSHHVRHWFDRARDPRPTHHLTLERAQFADTVLCQDHYHDSRLWYTATYRPRRPCWRKNTQMYLPWWSCPPHVLRTPRASRPHSLPGHSSWIFATKDSVKGCWKSFAEFLNLVYHRELVI